MQANTARAGVLASRSGKGQGTELEEKRQESSTRRMRQLQTQQEESSIAEKDHALELIMSAEALAGFEQMGRFRLNMNCATRVGIDPNRLASLDMARFAQLVDCSDLDAASDSDEELVRTYGMQEYQVGDDDNADGVPEDLLQGQGFRIGIGVPRALGTVTAQPERVFASRCGDYTLMGIVNGHGDPRIAGDLALFIASSMPGAVFRSRALAQSCDPAAALIRAFRQMHRRASAQFDLTLTGASCTVVLIDPEHLWTAHVGDCRAVLGVPDPQPDAQEFHFTPIPLTQDHKMSVKREFDRIQVRGGEMRRLIGDNVSRIFVKDTDLPGLTVTRAIGHRLGHMIGVSHVPTVGAMRRQDVVEGSVIILGSGGLWATMAERRAVNWVSRYFSDANEAAESLAGEGLHRWEEKGSRAKACLLDDMKDCFSTVVVIIGDAGDLTSRLVLEDASVGFDDCIGDEDVEVGARLVIEDAPTLAQRSFATGPKSEHARHKWDEVKSAQRVLELRVMQANGRPLLGQ